MTSPYTSSSPIQPSPKRPRIRSRPASRHSESENSDLPYVSPRASQSKRKYERISNVRQTKKEKYQSLVDLMKQYKWTTKDVLQCWLDDDMMFPNHQRLRTPKLRRQALQDALVELELTDRVPDVSHIVQEIRLEFDELTTHKYFAKFDSVSPIEDINFPAAVAIIETKAPVWTKLVLSLLTSRFAHRPSYKRSSKAIPNRVFTLTAMICHSQRIQSSNFFINALSMYLGGSGVKRRVIDTLAGLGICQGHTTTLGLINGMAKQASTLLKPQLSRPQASVVYDNFNYQDTKRDESIINCTKSVNITTAAVTICKEIPETGLLQSMHRPWIPLQRKTIERAPGLTGNDKPENLERIKALSTYHIANAIRTIHDKAVTHVFDSSSDTTFPVFPEFDRLKPQKTEFYQFGSIPFNEAIISDNYQVQDEIFLHQGNLKRGTIDKEGDFAKRLFVIHGDQMTAGRCRAVKANSSESTLDYDRRKWYIPMASWFHIHLNLGETILRTHWEPSEGSQSPHNVLYDIDSWGAVCRKKKSMKYHQLRPILGKGFNSRITALFYTEMRQHRLLPSTFTQDSDIPTTLHESISNLTPKVFLQLVEKVRLKVFQSHIWEGKAPEDIDFRSMCRYLQEVQLYLNVNLAVKYGDIGLLRFLIDPLIVTFFGANQLNYGWEMLHYKWHLTEVNDTVLQRSILASGLVNWLGRETTWKPIDLMLEHLNGFVANEMKCFKNSTHDAEVTLNRSCLTNPYLRVLRSMFEGYFGNIMSGSHSTSKGVQDMMIHSIKLFNDGWAHKQTPAILQSRGKPTDSPDIMTTGINMISSKVQVFNQRYLQKANGQLPPSLPSVIQDLQPGLVDADGFIDIDESVQEIGPDLDHIVETSYDGDGFEEISASTIEATMEYLDLSTQN